MDSSRLTKGLRGAGFVPIDEGPPPPISSGKTDKGKFKYLANQARNATTKVWQALKRHVLTASTSLRRALTSGAAWRDVSRDTIVWCVEALIEGFILNFGLHTIFSLPMNIGTVFGYGCISKFTKDYVVELRERLKQHGPSEPVPPRKPV